MSLRFNLDQGQVGTRTGRTLISGTTMDDVGFRERARHPLLFAYLLTLTDYSHYLIYQYILRGSIHCAVARVC